MALLPPVTTVPITLSYRTADGEQAQRTFTKHAGAVLGIPGGVALIAVLGADDLIMAPSWQLLAVVPATAIVAVLTALPARAGARRPVAEILRSELA